VSRRPVLLLVNPAAGGKPGATAPAVDPEALRPDALVDRFRAAGLDPQVHVLSERDEPRQLAADAAARGSDVVVAGGDGTVQQVATAVAHSEVALGILPTGSFNNIARGLRVPLELEPAVAAIAEGRAIPVDVGIASWSVPGEPFIFLEAAGVGLDAVGFAIAELTRRRGLAAGLHAAWRLLRWQPHRVRVALDDEEPTASRILLLVVSNAAYYGLGFTVADEADPTDGRFAVSLFVGMGRFELARHFMSIARGRRHYDPRIRSLVARRVRVETVRTPLPVHADGHDIGTTPVVFEVSPGALRVFGVGEGST
jgi:diacylglycerol kinase (ATP)